MHEAISWAHRAISDYTLRAAFNLLIRLRPYFQISINKLDPYDWGSVFFSGIDGMPLMDNVLFTAAVKRFTGRTNHK
ncbi:hypothetical protein MPP7335_02365 [Mycolicibacterium parafortuitum]|uniref:Uncharacterized protein n=1 Tax=Mycolicibacterium parafortuitum TaxID=39692 RepID=A0A375YHN0_MYCPF|nr:hypothetical protein MPP7335_02365 [Mycolicibacterium parafortuitum]